MVAINSSLGQGTWIPCVPIIFPYAPIGFLKSVPNSTLFYAILFGASSHLFIYISEPNGGSLSPYKKNYFEKPHMVEFFWGDGPIKFIHCPKRNSSWEAAHLMN